MRCDFPGALNSTPFEVVTLTRLADVEGEADDWVVIEGRRDGERRSVRVPYRELLEQANTHLRFRHGKSLDDPMDIDELVHATIRAAVAFLID